jgi:exodeoxyribonuclease V alpha subunit
MPSLPIANYPFSITRLDLLTIADLLSLGGCPDNADVAAILALLCEAVNQGSLCLPLDPPAIASRQAGAGVKKAEQMVEAFLDRATREPFAAIVGCTDGYRPLVLRRATGGYLLYFHKHFEAERILQEGLTRLAGAVAPAWGDPALPGRLQTEALALRGTDGRPHARDKEQEAAVTHVLQSPLTLISGGPGTGKTTLLVTLLRCLVRSGVQPDRIALAAPTGRAARRLTEAVERGVASIRQPAPQDWDLLNVKAGTLHRLLRFQPSRNAFFFTRANPLALDIVIVDEASMVDALLLAALVEAIDPAATRLVLVGDKDQLPSVEAGAALADMVAAQDLLHGLRLIELKRSHRVGPGLANLAAEVNAGRCPPQAAVNWDTALAQSRDSWTLVAGAGAPHWHHGLSLWAQTAYFAPCSNGATAFKDLVAQAAGQPPGATPEQPFLNRIFAVVNRSRILTLTREGAYGCKAANAHVARVICRAMDPWADPDRGFFAGALVMVVRNDYAKSLFNGDVGVILADGSGDYRAWFPQGRGFAAFAPETLPPWELAFAVTVHKSQGSEYDRVLLALSDDCHHPLMTREMLYTAITRARHNLIVFGSPEGLAAAASRKIQRFSGRWSPQTGKHFA